ncbi:MAG: phosphoglycerate kinase [Verrucomicrobiota bacterium]
MSKAKTIDSVDLSRKRVFVRVDFNVPLDSNGTISDDSRIVAALPTIKNLIEQGAKVILGSHLGRPKGKVVPEMSLAPIAKDLSAKLGQPVAFVGDCIGPDVKAAVDALEPGSVLLLENLRFHEGEEKNDPAFTQDLASVAEAFVNDAFGTAHRAHASTAGVCEFLHPKVAGYLIEKELAYLGEKTNNPEKPFVVILGGAKVSDKIAVIDSLLDKADTMLIGGAMAYTFALANGKTVGDSLCETDKVDTAKAALKKAEEKGVQFLLPSDNLIAKGLDFKAKAVAETETVSGNIPDGWEGVDIGPETIETFSKAIAGARTILWNGPMGIFEIEECSKGTFAIADAVASSEGTSIIGGGDSVKAIKKSGFSDRVTFMSTGGGASLEFLEGKTLPGVAALDQQ